MVEKDFMERAEREPYFEIADETCFVVARPQNPSNESVKKIQNYIIEIDKEIHEGNLDSIDINSFASVFLTEEIALNFDAFRSSSFF